MITIRSDLVNEIFAHAVETAPGECCGLVGVAGDGRTQRLYRLRNVAPAPLISYEAAPEELFAAQRLMREREEQLLAIYHSHPRAAEPMPSDTDVRLAYYPETIYFIVGLAGAAPVLRAFRILEKDQAWNEVEYEITDE